MVEDLVVEDLGASLEELVDVAVWASLPLQPQLGRE